MKLREPRDPLKQKAIGSFAASDSLLSTDTTAYQKYWIFYTHSSYLWFLNECSTTDQGCWIICDTVRAPRSVQTFNVLTIFSYTHKSWAPGALANKSSTWRLIFIDIRKEVVSRHFSGARNFEFFSRFLENLLNPGVHQLPSETRVQKSQSALSAVPYLQSDDTDNYRIRWGPEKNHV